LVFNRAEWASCDSCSRKGLVDVFVVYLYTEQRNNGDRGQLTITNIDTREANTTLQKFKNPKNTKRKFSKHLLTTKISENPETERKLPTKARERLMNWED